MKRKRDTLTIEVNRPGGTFLYRQRADTPTILESRAYRKGSRWAFLARYDTAEEARRALLQLGKEPDAIQLDGGV